MPTIDNFPHETALAKQRFQELDSLLGGLPEQDEEIIAAQFDKLPIETKSRAVILSQELVEFLNAIEIDYPDVKSESPPVVELPDEHLRFLTRVLLPNGETIRDIYWVGYGFKEILGARSQLGDETESARFHHALDHLIEFWTGTLSLGEEEEYSEFIETLDDLRAIVTTNWFDPDAWEMRKGQLRPIFLPHKGTGRLRDHIRIRILEIHQNFIFGQYLSCLAMSRSLVEFILFQRASKLGIVPTDDTGRDKSLSQLIDDLQTNHPEIAQVADQVREYGNRVMHPEKRSIVSIRLVRQDEARKCIDATTQLVERVYEL